MESKLIRVTSRYFCAGIIIENDKVVKAAPILYKKLFGLSEDRCKIISRENNWNWEEVKRWLVLLAT